MNTIKVGIIIPDRNDREEFLKNCLRMLNNQTMKPDIVELINEPAKTEAPDITYRYRTGYDKLRNKGLDVILLIENDDYYCPEYIEIMVNQWIRQGQPQIVGTDYTIYYHLGLKKHFMMNHKRRASAMNTLLKADMDFPWCVDHEPYTDIHLWNTLNGVPFHSERVISIGMKHGMGKCGGRNHDNHLHRFVNDDKDLLFLQKNVDPESFKFYKNLNISM